ncbi:hypothetical protein QJS04_geneDACA020958 [Acorus gramineus]|uniref:Uncharacterized protein n=1 Tax=Acorus gramineus TaxID=55184 RepID=A0AAV9B301_ACOGR|nr:hypothetical protein QJS04_geneDACA020958 [Acorus gramineus]
MNLFRSRSSPDPSLALPTNESHTMLFGVDLSKPPMKKFKSMIDLNTYPSSSDRPSSLSPNQSRPPSSSSDLNYHSDGGVPKKKRVPMKWAEDEHMRFLEGLEALGRGEWAGIARDYVITRNATQVASHAQKHFLYQLKNKGKQRRGSSIFDLPPPPPPEPAPQRQTNNVENPTPVRVRIPFWMHIGVSNSAPNSIKPRANPNMQCQ